MSEADLARLIENMSDSLGAEIGSLRTEMKDGFARLEARMDSFDRRLKHSDSNMTVALELLVKQSRWHQETDATVESDSLRSGKLEADMTAIKKHLNLP